MPSKFNPSGKGSGPSAIFTAPNTVKRPLLTDAECSKEFEKLGGELTKLNPGNPAAGPPNPFKPILGVNSNQYRALDPGKDEYLPTSGVVNLSKGFLAHPSNPTQKAVLESHLQVASQDRSPTSYAGGEWDQHPTSLDTGAWRLGRGGGAGHSIFNRARTNHVLRKMQAAFKKPNANIERVMRAGIAASREFSVNLFYAPILAVNMTQYARGRPLTAKEKVELMKLREKIKRRYQKDGGYVEPGRNGYSTPWAPMSVRIKRAMDGSMSPFRKRKKGQT